MRIFPCSFGQSAGSNRPAFTSLLTRFYSSVEADGGGPSGFRIFNRDLKRKQRDRAAWLVRPKDVLVDTVAANLLDRLQDWRKTFPTALCTGGSLHAVTRSMRGHDRHGGIEKPIMMDMSHDMIRLCKKSEQDDVLRRSMWLVMKSFCRWRKVLWIW